MDASELSKEQLICELRKLAAKCSSNEQFRDMLSEEIHGVCATVVYCGRMYMGMAMSHFHNGSISF